MADTTTPNASTSTTPNANENVNNNDLTPMQRVTAHMKGNKIEASLWVTRMCTIIFSLMYILPIGGGLDNYKRALMANAATCALRLHQRLPPFQLSLAYGSSILLEDSAHYLFFSLIFLYSVPVTMVMIPIFLFSLLHASSYSKQLLNKIGPNSVPFLRTLLAKLDATSMTILRLVAVNEILMMPIVIISVFTGKGSIVLVIFYYRFLCLRYNSRRNPYCRQIFFEIRVSTEQLIAKPMVPQIARNIVLKVISLINRLAPIAV